MIAIALDKENVIKQTAQNMIEAGIIKPEEYISFANLLRNMSKEDLLIALIESHDYREQAPERISFYPIDIEAISMN